MRRLYAGALRWRLGVRAYAVILAALPVLTVIIAAAGGSLRSPAGGVLRDVALYLFITLVFGTLLGNLWEEIAWAGFAQTRLTERHGVLRGALLTAVPFALIHLPLAYEEHGLHGTSLGDAAVTWAVLILSAPFFRYLLGVTLAATGGSVLAVALLHASFNASGALASVHGWWPAYVAMLAAAVLAGTAATGLRPGSTTAGTRQPDRSAR